MNVTYYMTSRYDNNSGLLKTQKQSQTNPILPAYGGFTRHSVWRANPIYGEHSRTTCSELVEPILSGFSLFSLFILYSLFFLSPTPNSFSNNYLHKNDPSDSAQFKQFGAPLALFRKQFQSDSRVIPEQFETIGDNSRQNTKALQSPPCLNLYYVIFPPTSGSRR